MQPCTAARVCKPEQLKLHTFDTSLRISAGGSARNNSDRRLAAAGPVLGPIGQHAAYIRTINEHLQGPAQVDASCTGLCILKSVRVAS